MHMKTFTTIILFFMLTVAYAQKNDFSGQTNDFYLDFTSTTTESTTVTVT